MSQIKLLLVDDSSLVRKVLKSLFADDNKIVVSDEAEDGKVALDKIKSNDFDMVLLDYEMPHMNGLEVLKAIKSDSSLKKKPPVIVFSSLTNKGSRQTIECLLAGAKDYIPKPSRSLGGSGTLDEVKDSLKEKIVSIVGSKSKPDTIFNGTDSSASKGLASATSKDKLKQATKPVKIKDLGLVVIGSSTGGPAALEAVLKQLPANYKYPILIAQHMPETFTTILAETLTNNTNITVHEVLDSTEIKPGHAYLAPGGKHMIMKDSRTLDVEVSPPVNFCIPSVDVLFKSVAAKYKSGSVLSIMLTGMGKDGREGVQALKDSLKCFSIAQDEATSVVWAMPRVVYEAGLSDRLMPLNAIGGFMNGA